MYTSFLANEFPEKSHHRNKYVAEVTFMHGDADGYTTEEISCKREEVLDLANFLDRCSKTQSEASGGPGYEGVPGYDVWGEDFPSDVQYSGMASFESFKFFYYNSLGEKHAVTLRT